MVIVPTKKWHLEDAAEYISHGDREEFNRMQEGRSIKKVLMGSLGPTSMTICKGDRVLATGGSEGCLWFITTHRVTWLTRREKAELLRLLKQHLEAVRKVNLPEHMGNCVWEGNEPHIRLLDALGAHWLGTAQSPAGNTFRVFTL